MLDDYLGLLQQPLGHYRLLVFHGASGSGKSSQLRLLATQHPDLQGRHRRWVQPNDPLPAASDVLLIDELQVMRDARVLGPALRRCELLLVASHLPPWLLWPWRCGREQRCYRLDDHVDKLRRELQRRQIAFSEAALTNFVQRLGANYSNLDAALELAPGGSLDAAVAQLQRGARIAVAAPPAGS